jgi:hypothetical protein
MLGCALRQVNRGWLRAAACVLDLVNGRRTVRSARERIFHFFRDPERADEEVNDTLKECWLISFDPMTGEEQDPSADKEREADPPPRDEKKHETRDDHRNSNGVHHFVPGIGVLVVVLRHVLTQ